MSRWFALVLVLAAMAGCTTVSPPSAPYHYVQTAPATVDPATAARLVSAIRADHGLPPVTVDPALNAIAQHQADAMAAADAVSHTVGGEFRRRLGGHYALAVENIGAGYATFQQELDAWVASPEHFTNLTYPGVVHIGVATAFNAATPYRNFYALVLAAP